MKSKAELIILNHTKFGENSIVLHTLSSEYGRRGFLVKVSPRTAMALFLPLNILEAEVTENPKSSLWFARNFVSVNPLNGIRSNIHKNTMTLFMSEVLYRVVKDQTNEDGLADWLKGQILTLDALQSDFANFHLLLPLTGVDRNAIAESILKYIEYHTESAVNVRSLAVLREIYGDC